MTMPKQNRAVEKIDLMPLDTYEKNRKEIRQALVNYKKNRRIPLGPYSTFYFESYETMLGQIQEMIYIEKGGDEQLKDELQAYNPLIPKGTELVATLMFEIDDPILRSDFLGKVGGIENNVYMKIGDDEINATPEKDLDRTSDEGKASSVQFLHFNFEKNQIEKFKNLNTNILIGIRHKYYNHEIQISKDNQESLIKDFN